MSSSELNKQIITAYRHLFKASLAAVQYSKPARFVVEDHLRNAFRKSPQSDFEPDRIARTVEFLNGAARVRGLEHGILKNLMLTWWYQDQNARRGVGRHDKHEFAKLAYAEHRRTVEMLNATMGTCIK